MTIESLTKEQREEIKEERCSCGANIPRGHGYYNYNQCVQCMFCGKINKKEKKGIR